MLNIYDRQTRKKTAVLQNAFDVIETHELNQIYSLTFSMPSTDEKNKYCLPRHYVRWGDDGELYRIKTPKTAEGDIGIITYECEHVITTLCDNIMFGSVQYGGGTIKTSQVINWLLNQQKTKNWVLDRCAFDRKFEYLWEQENILNALYSIPREFATPYKWTFDTTVYPWRLSLDRIDSTIKPEYYLRAKSNILSSETAADYANICTRLYPLGYGEGVNQLTIKNANVTSIVRDANGTPINGTTEEDTKSENYGNVYIQSPQAIVDQYGIVEKVLVDRRFESATSLMAYAQTMLDLYQTPSMSRSFSVTDLYPLTNNSWDDAEVGKICRMVQDGTTAYITRCKWQRDKAGDLEIDLSTKATDISSSVADLADRVRIESVYSQGATQLYQHSKDANATPQKGMIMSLYFPEEMRQINKVLLRVKLNKFRSYSQTTTSNGGVNQTLKTDATPDVAITTQENVQSETVSLTWAATDITTQTNKENSSATVSWTGGTYTAGMTADENQNVTTTADGGGTGTTGANTSDTSIDITSTTDPVYNATDEYGYVNAATISNLQVSITHSSDYSTVDTDEADGSQGMHKHGYYRLYDHNHNGTVDSFTPIIHKYALNHTHDVSMTNVGTHRHSFSIRSHTHKLNIGHKHQFTIPSKTISIPCPKHTHSLTVPAKTFNVACPKHKHKMTIPGHSHKLEIPAHDHGIVAGIFESSKTATRFIIYVDGVRKTSIENTSYDGDITQWLLDSSQKIPRNRWIDVEIRPNDLAYVVSSVFIQGFVQSRGGGNY